MDRYHSNFHYSDEKLVFAMFCAFEMTANFPEIESSPLASKYRYLLDRLFLMIRTCEFDKMPDA